MSKSIDIVVRPFEFSDAGSFLAAVKTSTAELGYWMPWCTPEYGLEDAQSWMRFCEAAWSERSEFPLGIFDGSSGEVIGGTGINQINKTHRVGNIGYWVSTPFIGRGVATEAARRSAMLGFGELGFTRLEIVALTHNLASQRVAARVGAVRECVARNRLFFHGQPHDAFMFSLVPDDLHKGHGGDDA
jgi:ribosomal-protein-serine acetyltransferase